MLLNGAQRGRTQGMLGAALSLHVLSTLGLAGAARAAGGAIAKAAQGE
jgi:hypothetical protein